MTATDRGRLVAPNLDDRDWSALVDEARALIPRYAPQWTDHNPSDIGITLVELFAYLVEGLIYRLNQVPEKNFVEFLNLIGVTRDPAEPAKAYLTFKAQPGSTVTVPQGQQAQTKGTAQDPPVVFETDTAVTVRPSNLTTALFARKTSAGAYVYTNLSPSLTQAGAAGAVVQAPVGMSLVVLGFDQPLPQLEVGFELDEPIDAIVASQATVQWSYSSGTASPVNWPNATVTSDDTAALRRDGTVGLQAPVTWAQQNPSAWTGIGPATSADAVTTPLYWLELRIVNVTSAPLEVGFRRVLFNTAPAHNALTVTGETLGTSDGSAFQRFELANAPLYRRGFTDTPYDHLVLQVGGITWTLVDDFPAGLGDVYRLDPVAGEISFGDYDATTRPGGHGSIPAAGATIVASTYRYVVGGAAGNVGAGTITLLGSQLAGIIGVTNLGSAEGGADEESIEDAKRRGPEVLRNRYRAVTAEDYEYLAREASTDIATVRALEPRVFTDASSANAGYAWLYGHIDRSPGNVTVIVVPRAGVVAPRPQPTKDLLDEVRRYLDRRRDVTAQLAVVGPRYLPIRVDLDAYVWQRAIDNGLVVNAASFYADLASRVKAFLHPVTGGPDGNGWEVGQSALLADVYLAAMPDEHVGYIDQLTLTPEVPDYHYPPIGPGGAWNAAERPYSLVGGAYVIVADYELVCAGTVNVTQNPPVSQP
jgi:hypothetical protein